MCGYREAGESRGAGWLWAATLAATLLGLILMGVAGAGRATSETSPVVFGGTCPVRVWEGSSFQIEVRSADYWNRIAFFLVFKPVTAGESDYLSGNGAYNTPNPGRFTFHTAPDDLAEGDETFLLRVGSDATRIGAIAEQRCTVTILDDDLMQVRVPYIPG